VRGIDHRVSVGSAGGRQAERSGISWWLPFVVWMQPLCAQPGRAGMRLDLEAPSSKNGRSARAAASMMAPLT
jgi:hypothetical protein